MTREERLEYLAHQLAAAAENEKAIVKERKELRDEFLRLSGQEWKRKDHLLPVITVEVPREFFHVTGLSKDEFAKSRFPGWDIEHVEYDISTEKEVFVFKRNPDFMSGVYEYEDVKVTREVAEYTPEVDWDTLDKERPDLFERLAEPVYGYELNEDELVKLSQENPEDLVVIQRHLKVKPPTQKIVPKRIVKDDGE